MSPVQEKLDFLMKLTDTRNSTLAKTLNFDPSYISRLRSGKRGLPKGVPFVEPASLYFARKLSRSPLLQRSAADVIIDRTAAWPETAEEGAKLIGEWLEDDERRISDLRFASTGEIDAYSAPADCLPQAFFLGNAGKREGVLCFLRMLARETVPARLFLYSDEEMSWLYEVPSFAREWAELLMGLIRRGTKIVIIHSLYKKRLRRPAFIYIAAPAAYFLDLFNHIYSK